MLVAEGSKGRLRILVVDDHEVVRSGLRRLLSRAPWVERCTAAASLEQALLLVAALAFDVALVDVDLGLACGLQACGRLRAVAPDLRTALLTSRWDLVPMRSARAVGAYGAIAKDQPPSSLLAAVRAVAAGRACERQAAAPGQVRFIPREKEILRLVAAGRTNAEIGAALFLAPGTIKHHMIELLEKLEAPNRAAAVHAARRLGVLSDVRPEEPAPGGVRVSPRERDVLQAFAGGATNRAIAGSLGLSPHTVKQHASSIFRKLGVRNRAEAVQRADELGLL